MIPVGHPSWAFPVSCLTFYSCSDASLPLPLTGGCMQGDIDIGKGHADSRSSSCHNCGAQSGDIAQQRKVPGAPAGNVCPFCWTGLG